METHEHTPTPYRIGTHHNRWAMLAGADNDIEVICVGGLLNDDDAEAQMNRVVQVCNSHDELVAALQECITDTGAYCFAANTIEKYKRRIETVNKVARDALAHATGQTEQS